MMFIREHMLGNKGYFDISVHTHTHTRTHLSAFKEFLVLTETVK